jgi:heme oxygenase
LPIYEALESALVQRESGLLKPLVRPDLFRSEALRSDLAALGKDARALPVLEQALAYVRAIERASEGSGGRLIAHAYVRYLGDLSGGQILKRLLAESLRIEPAFLSFYDFPLIRDIAAYKSRYREALDAAGRSLGNAREIIVEGERAFSHNIELSCAVASMNRE